MTFGQNPPSVNRPWVSLSEFSLAVWGHWWSYNRMENNCAGSRMMWTSRWRTMMIVCMRFCSVSAVFSDQFLKKIHSSRSSEHVEMNQCTQVMVVKCSHVPTFRISRRNSQFRNYNWDWILGQKRSSIIIFEKISTIMIAIVFCCFRPDHHFITDETNHYDRKSHESKRTNVQRCYLPPWRVHV